MCVEKGMVAGYTQSIDSALIKANASLEKLEVKQPKSPLSIYVQEVKKQDEDGDNSKNKLAGHETKPRKNIKRSNKTHFSPTDPDAKIAYKPGKLTNLYYMGR